MKSAKSSGNSFSKNILIHAINLIDAFGTGIGSVAAFVCLVILDGWVLKLGGVVGCLGGVCFVIYLSDRLKEKLK